MGMFLYVRILMSYWEIYINIHSTIFSMAFLLDKLSVTIHIIATNVG